MTRLESYLSHLQRFGIQPGLERIEALLESAGHPESKYPIVLVGGTNGKGSTCEFLARSLAAEGNRAGLYTSPHLYNWNERIRILGEDDHKVAGSPPKFEGAISDEELDALYDDARPLIEDVAQQFGQPTEFETMTFLGLWHFARTDVDAAVVEVGLGGRWDATNATDPAVSVITHVALDHCDRLGDTLQEIAADKIEIARPDRILVTAETKSEVLKVFREYCSSHDALLWSIHAPEWSDEGEGFEETMAMLRPAYEAMQTKRAEGTADFQHLNWLTAATAKAALETTLGRPLSAPSSLPAPAQVPGRTEVLRNNPDVIIDGANNPDGAAHLANYLTARLTASPGARLILVLGILADKDHTAMVAHLAPLASCVVATQSSSPRATAASVIADEAVQHCPNVETITPVGAAVERALELAGADDIVCVTGSFYTIAELDREQVKREATVDAAELGCFEVAMIEAEEAAEQGLVSPAEDDFREMKEKHGL